MQISLFAEAVVHLPSSFVCIVGMAGDPVAHIRRGGRHLLRGRVTPDWQHLHTFLGQSMEIDVDIGPVVLVGCNLYITLEISAKDNG